MYTPDENDILETKDAAPAEQPDRVSGEYHYKNGYTQRIYSDSHYVREDETTTPPRYYTPPEKPVKEAKTTKQKKSVGIGGLIALCLVCALLGGIGGGAMVGSMMNNRMTELEESVADLSDNARQPASIFSASTAEASGEAPAAAATLTAGEIYDMAVEQVVGITTEVTVTNFFGMTSSSAVTGSGFVVSEDGYILTNYHVIEYAYKGDLDVTVILHDGTRYTAQIVAVEPDNDIAVLKIEAEGLSAATIGDSDALHVGDAVYAVGNPLGELDFSMTSGHVSAKDRSIKTDESTSAIGMFQIDAAVNAGNSGGPVYNDRGEVVGIVTAKYSETGVEGIGFAIPVNDAAAIANDLITSGYVTGKAYLGVTVNTNYNEMYARYYGWPIGAYINSVNEGSCAEAAGIEAGDIITRVGDYEVEGFDDLKATLKSYHAGDSVEIEVYHADESRTVTVVLDEAVPETQAQQPQQRPAANQ